ncbi:hypothetical protein ADUPG1_009090 [Aduncisulcus paluster]|uniref:Protein kinase domain-containing protein n=1 Tax=Aduncisulcus paluster TaxID=2918883 RepID=A0ABQ5KWM6_9EUKA|nr:hypothetical protein ADUPG1_009090 [Aduncisulcus paluster]
MAKITGKLMRYNYSSGNTSFAVSPHLYTDPFPIHPSEIVKIDDDKASVDKHTGGANMKGFLSNTNCYIYFGKQMHLPFVGKHNVQYFCISYSSIPNSIQEFNATFTTSSGVEIVKEYQFENHPGRFFWQIFPVDLDDIVRCDLELLKCWNGNPPPASNNYFYSIRFLSKDFELIDQPCIQGKHIMDTHSNNYDSRAYCGPYPVGHSQVAKVDVSKASCRFTQGEGRPHLKNFFTGKGYLHFFPFLDIPFTSPHYIGEFCMSNHSYPHGIKRFDAVFTDSSGKRFVKKYEIIKPDVVTFFWVSFPVDLPNIREKELKWKQLVDKQIATLVGHLSEKQGQIDNLLGTVADQGDVIRRQEDTIQQQISEQKIQRQHLEQEISSCKTLISSQSKLITLQSKQIATLLCTTSQLQKTISEHRSDLDGHTKNLADSSSLIDQHRQHFDHQGSMLERTCKSLQSELSALSVRVAGQSVSVSRRVQDEHDQVLERRRSLMPDLDTLVPLYDEDSVDSHSPCQIVSSLAAEDLFQTSLPRWRFLSMLVFTNDQLVNEDIHNAIDASHIVDVAGYRDLHNLRELCLSSLPAEPCSSALESKIKGICSECSRVCSRITSSRMEHVIKANKSVCLFLLQFFSQYLSGLDQPHRSSGHSVCSRSSLITSSEHLSSPLSECLVQFDKVASVFEECVSKYGQSEKYSCFDLDILVDDSWSEIEQIGTLDLEALVSEVSSILHGVSSSSVKSEEEGVDGEKEEEKKDGESYCLSECLCECSRKDYSDPFLSSISFCINSASIPVHCGEDGSVTDSVDSTSYSHPSHSHSKKSPQNKTIKNENKTSHDSILSLISNLHSSLPSSCGSTLHPSFTETISARKEFIHKNISFLQSMVSECHSQASTTDSKFTSLEARLNGQLQSDSCFDADMSIIDVEDNVIDQCKKEIGVLSDSESILSLSSPQSIRVNPDIESFFLDCLKNETSSLEQAIAYLRMREEMYLTACCCVLRVRDLCSMRKSVARIEQSPTEMKCIAENVEKMKEYLKSNKVKMEVIKNEIVSLTKKLDKIQQEGKEEDKKHQPQSETLYSISLPSLSDEGSDDTDAESISRTISALKTKLDKFKSAISHVRAQMNDQFHHSFELHQHASFLTSLGFSVPPVLSMGSLLSDEPSTAQHIPPSHDSSLPFLFTIGMNLELFHDIQQLTSSDTSGPNQLFQGGFKNEGNIFTARWDQSCVGREHSELHIIMKFFPLDTSSPASFRHLLRSAITCRRCGDCPYIVPLLGAFTDNHVSSPKKEGAYLLFPFYEQGDLCKWISSSTSPSRSLQNVTKILKCILHALAYLHSQDIVHCDLKPQNVLVDSSGNGLLCDFEGAVDCSERTMRVMSQTMRIATKQFIAPEIVRDVNNHRRPHPTPACDMFSFGVLIQDIFQLWEQSDSESFIPMPDELSVIVSACTTRDTPQSRPTAIQLLSNMYFL